MVHCQKRVIVSSNMATITSLLCLVLALTSSCLCCEDFCPGPVQANVRAIQRQTQLLSQQLEKLVAAVNRLEENCDDQQNTTAPSGPPRGVVGSPRSESSIIIQWQPPDEDQWNGPLLGYKIRYKPSGYPDSTVTIATISSYLTLMHELTSLIVSQEYEIMVGAYNKKGVGVFSPVIKVWTQEGSPTAAPRDVLVTAISSTAVDLTFLPPDPQRINGINQGYKVEVTRPNLSDPDKLITIPSNTSNMLGQQKVRISQLKKFTDYRFRVLCFTSKGDGPMSTPLTVRTMEDVPEQVGSLVFDTILDTSFNVIWTPPPNINGILTGYTLSYMRKNQTISRVTKELGPNTLNYTITGLTATTTYTIEVFPNTRVGPGPASSADIDSGIRPDIARNCAEVQTAGNTADGVYTIYPGGPGGPQRSVYCDLTTDGGGWTLFQRRMNGSIDFFRDLGPYKRGFGKPSSEYWLGLNKILLLVQQGPQELRVDLEAFDGATAYAQYSEFYIDGAQGGYKLHVTGYSGTAGDSLAIHSNKPFATRDHDSPDNCAVTYHGAWWYQSCHHSNLNGQYFVGGSHSSYANGINWYHWKGYHYSMKRTEMKIRPADFLPST